MRILLLLTLLFITTLSFSQDCESYYPFKENTELHYDVFNGKGKSEGSSIQKISDIKTIDGGFVATVNFETTDKKGKKTSTGDFEIQCKNNVFSMDVESMLPPEMSSMFEGQKAEMTVEGDGFSMAENPKVGQTFPDTENTVSFKMGVMNMNLKINYSEHKVEAKESITTEAGTFDCFRISYVADFKMSISKSKIKVVNWYTNGIGVVKSESYNGKNGKLTSSTILTKVVQ
ncbi:MAG: hypothetical protein AAFO07_04405 [Bacteroidota bacterium]